jgi:hypothetical protein
VSFGSKAPRVAGGLLLFSVIALLAGCGPGPNASEAANLGPPLESPFDSPEALARTVLEAFAKEDVETLKALPLTKEEFRVHVWPKLPASRPERNVPFDYGWTDLHQKSVSSIASNFKRYKGRKLELLSITFKGDTTDYESFVVRRKSMLRVKDRDTGEELSLALFGSVMEWNGKYKLFSYVTD